MIIIVIIKIMKNKNKLKQLVVINLFFFISAICLSQWYFTSYVLQKLYFIFHNHVSQSARPSLSFKMMLDFLTFSKCGSFIDPQSN